MLLKHRMVWRAVCALLINACIISVASADDVYWDSEGGGLFNDDVNWDPIQVPGTDDVAIFDLDSWISYVVDFSGGSVTNKQMIVRTDLVEFDLSGNTYTLTPDGFHPLIVGENGGDFGSLILYNGSIETHRIDLGFWGGTGDLIVDASANIVSDTNIVVGHYGVGVLTVDGADVRTIDGSGWITAGENAGSEGYIYVQGGGVLEAEAAPINIGDNGHGEMEIYEYSSVISDGELFIGNYSASGSGSVLIYGEDASYVSNSVYLSVVGGYGEGYLSIVDGGSMQCIGVEIGTEAGGLGVVELIGYGSVLRAEQLYVGGAGSGELIVGDGRVILGETEAETESIYDGTVFMGAGGQLRGTGSVDAVEVINEHGLVGPGDSDRLLSIQGEYTQLYEGFVEFHIAGTERGVSYSAIDVSGNVSLDGGMMLWFEDGFIPELGQTFDLIVSDSFFLSTGNPFSAVYVFGLDPWNGDWRYSLDVVNGNTLRLTSLSTVPVQAGDLNGDGFVGLDDLDIVLNHWNQNVTANDWLQGDPSGDGYVGLDDLDIVLNNWNAGTPPSVTANIPEPAALVLLGVGGLVLTCRRLRAA